MTKIYNSLQATIPDLSKITIEMKESALPILTEEFLKDSNKRGLAPKLDGTLINSSLIASLFKKGIIIYDQPYAATRYYEGSVSGRPMWLEYNKRVNIKKYETLTAEIFKKIKREVI